MGLYFSKQTRHEVTHPLSTGPGITNSHLINRQVTNKLPGSQTLDPISNLTPNSTYLRQRIPNRFSPAIYSEPQYNWNDFIKAFHSVPRRLPAPKVLVRNRELVHCLLYYLKVPHLECFPYNQAWSLEQILQDSTCFDFVMEKFLNNKFNSNYSILYIQRVWNPYLMAQYMLTKKSGENNLVEKYLFHGTSYQALSGVLKENFDWRKVVTGKWGWGVSFANNPWYSSHYSKKKQYQNWPYVMVLAKVLVEDGEICEGNDLTIVPTTGYTTANPTKEVIVKYDDASFYPEFIVYFEEKMCF
ncbi:probable poly [ADP-ribose] polymerase DDB_G0278045 [Euwallacea fornicatus]|uniref:probable poly [ADP-ribose] polymerase DDB_G0278045 n=1 Tax=Euwallacea fornicatus TaxID=995702 RepID=UPI00338EEAA5